VEATRAAFAVENYRRPYPWFPKLRPEDITEKGDETWRQLERPLRRKLSTPIPVEGSTGGHRSLTPPPYLVAGPCNPPTAPLIGTTGW
jgi:hypothetical protein